MSRFILAVAVLLMASCVSAQTANVTVWTNQVTCGTTNTTTDGLPANATIFAVPTNKTCISAPVPAGFLVNFTSSCNSTTGVVSIQLFGDSNCSTTLPLAVVNSLQGGCSVVASLNTSISAASCPIVSTPTTTLPPTNTTTGPPTTTSPPTTSAPTNQTTPKPGVAASTNGVSFSIMAAVAAVIAVACL